MEREKRGLRKRSHIKAYGRTGLWKEWLKDIGAVTLLVSKCCFSCANTEPSAPLFQIFTTAPLYTSSPGQWVSHRKKEIGVQYRTRQQLQRKGTSHSLCPPQPSTPQLPGFRLSSSQKATDLDSEAFCFHTINSMGKVRQF